METLKVYKKNQGIRENAIKNVEYWINDKNLL
jgi:hypothetical protein